MAEDNTAQDASSSSTSCNNKIVTPFGQISPVWKQFGYKKDATGNFIKGALAYCKLCSQGVANDGGTTNLRNHLCLSHPSEYSILFPDDRKVEDKQSKIEDFVRPTTVTRFSATSLIEPRC